MVTPSPSTPAHIHVSPPSHPQPRNSLKKHPRVCLPPHAFPTPVNYPNTSLLCSPLSPTSSSETSPTRNSVTSPYATPDSQLAGKLIRWPGWANRGYLSAPSGCVGSLLLRSVSSIATTQPATYDSTPPFLFGWREVCKLARHEDTACLSLVRSCGTSAYNCASGQTTYL